MPHASLRSCLFKYSEIIEKGRRGGCLLLGKSESIGSRQDLFQALSKEFRIDLTLAQRYRRQEIMVFWAERSLSWIRHADETVEALIATITDMTPHKATEAA